MNIKEINTAIMHGNLTNEELNSINDAIRFARAQLVARNKMALSIGSIVKFKSSTRGVISGTVKKINRKYVLVNEAGHAFSTWRVPANMLEVV
jgi:hypothetical protein